MKFKCTKLPRGLKSIIQGILICSLFMAGIPSVEAQYFGRNKPRYQSFDFRVRKSKHFELYNYLNNADYRQGFLRWAEDWYTVHSALLGDSIFDDNPILLYNNHPEFQQTNAISGAIGVGTGGVTEALRNRVVMPLALTRQQTHHVIGHELVHAFQYSMILNEDSLSLNNLGNLPLWMVEGMAEYLSIGRHDPNTAMWMRDAVINDDIPTIEDLSSGLYFPYRYGEAFWAFVSGYYGDSYIKPLFMETARSGLDSAFIKVLGLSKEQLSKLWAESLRAYYTPLMKSKKKKAHGSVLIPPEDGASANIAPAISPNGKYLAYWSDKSLLSFDLYLADARTGEVINTITQSLTWDHFDYLNFMESGGTWSPDSRKIAFIVVEKGRHVLVVKDALSGKTLHKYSPQRTRAMYSPSWSPDGKYIVYAGMDEGRTNLYKLNLRTGNATSLTNGEYAHIQPSWSPDGKHIVFVTDYLSRTKYYPVYGKWNFNLAILNVETGEIQELDIFPFDNLFNPVFTAGNEIWFISDRKGYKNLFSYNTETGQLYQRTDAAVGVSGITPFSPALSYASGTDNIVYNSYFNKKYTLIAADRTSFPTYPVNRNKEVKTAGILPPINTGTEDVVNSNLNLLNRTPEEDVHYSTTRFKPRFKLDYISGSTGAGIGIGSFGTGTAMAGGILGIFSDITGDHQIFASAGLNGEIYDFAAAVQYLNRKHRIQWGVGLSHIPSRLGGSVLIRNTTFYIDDTPIRGDIIRTDIVRIFQDQIGLYAQYPFSRLLRVEAGIGATYQYYRADRYEQYYTYPFGHYLGQRRRRIDVQNSIYGNFRFDKGLIYNLNAGFVGDNSYMGPTGPIAGWRFRLSANKYLGLYDFYSVNVDLRKYFYLKPLTLAVRLFHYGRVGQDSYAFYPFYIGQLGLVRGLNFSGRVLEQKFGINVYQLLGSKVLLGSLELRLPFTGIKNLALIPLRGIYSDLVLFGDAGTAFFDYGDLTGDAGVPSTAEPVLVTTAGVALRVNLFGLIGEPYYAWFIHDGKAVGSFGFTLMIPGF